MINYFWKNKTVMLMSILLIGSVLLFQNCSNINLQPPGSNTPTSFVSGIRGQFCLKHPASTKTGTFTYVRHYVLPITSLPKGNILVADSDIDGVSDVDEQNSSGEFENSNRRTKGILDSLCQVGNDDCTPTVGSCNASAEPYFFGSIHECDLAAFSADGIKGLNLDGISSGNKTEDYIPDFIEALRGTNPASVDGVSTNSDLDTITNENEIIQNSDPSDPTSSSAVNRVFAPLVDDLTPNPDCNGQSSMSFSIPLFKTIPVAAFHPDVTSPDYPLRHAANENLGIVIVVTKNVIGDIQYQSFLLRVPHNSSAISLEIDVNDFVLDGEY